MPDALESCDMACNSNYHHDPAQDIEHKDMIRICNVCHRCRHYKQKPIRPAHYTPVVPAKMEGLGLGAEITGDKHTHYGNNPDLPLHMACKKDAANDYDISVAVYYVINEISLWAGGLEVSCHKAVDRIEQGVQRNHKSPCQH